MQQLQSTANLEESFQIPLYKKRDITLVRGEGVYLWDADGRRYLDMMSNYGVNILGHAHPLITAAIVEQAGRITNCHQSFYSDVRGRFIELIEALLPDGFRRISFSNSGSEAMESALKYARVATERRRIVSTRRSYHGRTMGALSVTGEQKYRGPFEPLLPDIEHIAYGDLEAAERLIPDAAAIVLEPIQGESGVRPATAEYLRTLRALCDECGTLLVFDEVQTAFRTGRTWAWEHSGARPDIMALSKPLASGLPMGVTVVSDAVAEKIPPGSHGSTFAGNPLCCAVGAVTLEIVSAPTFNHHVATVGAAFTTRLREIDHPLIREVRGVGLMVAVELKRNASPILQLMQADGVLVIPAGSTSVRFLPPLIVEEDHVMEAAASFERALQKIS